MYRLLIVDDEEFEREGMAQLIDWGQYDIEIVGTAWNGLEGFEKTCSLQPDIILTDIKMPVMDGIELIRKVRKAYPQIEFAVLSGYGEYDYTSKAMEQGVRHYILKPCNEERIVEAIGKVKRDVDTKREQKRREAYFDQVAPQARKQLFRNLLLDREEGRPEDLFDLSAGEAEPRRVRLLAFRGGESFNGLEEFVLGNMLEELLENQGHRAYVATVIRNDVVTLISDAEPELLVRIVRRIQREFSRIRRDAVRGALSAGAGTDSLSRLYGQIEELFRIGEELKSEPLLHYGMLEGKKQDMELLLDFSVLGWTEDYGELLQSLQVSFLRMQKRGFTLGEKRARMDWLLRYLYGAGLEAGEGCMADESGQSLMVAAAGQIWRLSKMGAAQGRRAEADRGEKPGNAEKREELRYLEALEEIYRHFQDQKLSLHYLATEILYVNEDYFGRFFQKRSGKRFTKFLLDIRISAAEELMRLEPDIMVYAVSEMTGYAADGQYFSKLFKKSTGMTPSEYREKVQQEVRRHEEGMESRGGVFGAPFCPVDGRVREDGGT